MASRLPSGTSLGGPLKTTVQSGVLRQEVISLMKGSNYRVWYERFEDFDQATLPSPWATKIVGTTPTVAKVANTANGVWRATLAATSEAETAGFDFGDSLILNNPTAGGANPNGATKPIFEAYVRIPTALTAAQTVVIGLGTAFNATLTSIAEYAWFRFNANMNVLLEGKDGTTTTLAQAPGSGTLTLLAATWYLFTINLGSEGATFAVDDNVLGNIPLAALTSAMVLQPMIYLQKASGTSVPTLDIDWAAVSNWRF